MAKINFQPNEENLMTMMNEKNIVELNPSISGIDSRLAALTRSDINLEYLRGNVPQISDLLRTAQRILDLDPSRATLMIQQATHLLGHGCESTRLLHVPKPRLVKGGLAPWQYRNVDLYIASNLTVQIRLEDLATESKLSVSHFSRAFKASYGEAPYMHIMRKRIELAQMLMLTTDEPLCQIAAICGLADQAHLSNLFRRYVGMSPFAWRRVSRPMSSAGQHVHSM